MSDMNLTQKNWTSWHHLLHKELLRDKKLIPYEANLLIAVSGGQDSMALLNLINDLKKQYNWSISVWHGDHQWHEKSSQYALSLKSYCEKKKITLYLDKAKKDDITSEEKARDWRYKKLSEKSKNLLIEKKQTKIYVLTGHTSTDNAETFILNLARGSNYAGLSNIESKRILEKQIYLIRPILIFTREDTKKFCESMNIPVWEDPTNSDIKIKRNLVRNRVIPILESIYPGCSERINTFTRKMKNYDVERNDLSKMAYLFCKKKKSVKRDLLNSLCLDARCTILNKFLSEVCTKQLSSKNLANLATEILKKNKGRIDLPENLKIVWDNNYIDFEKI